MITNGKVLYRFKFDGNLYYQWVADDIDFNKLNPKVKEVLYVWREKKDVNKKWKDYYRWCIKQGFDMTKEIENRFKWVDLYNKYSLGNPVPDYNPWLGYEEWKAKNDAFKEAAKDVKIPDPTVGLMKGELLKKTDWDTRMYHITYAIKKMATPVSEDFKAYLRFLELQKPVWWYYDEWERLNKPGLISEVTGDDKKEPYYDQYVGWCLDNPHIHMSYATWVNTKTK